MHRRAHNTVGTQPVDFDHPSIAGRSWISLCRLHRFSQNNNQGCTHTLTLAMMPWCLESLITGIL